MSRTIPLILILSLLTCLGSSWQQPLSVNLRRDKELRILAQMITNNEPEALSRAQRWEKREPDNSLGSYLVATAYAKKGDWEKANQSVNRGNNIVKFQYYIGEDVINQNYLGFAVLRTMVEDIQKAPDLTTDKRLEILRGLRRMGKKICKGHPRVFMTALVGSTLVYTAGRYQLEVLKEAGRTVEAAANEGRVAADFEWGQQLKQASDAALGDNGSITKDAAKHLRKQGFTPEEAQDLESNNVTDDTTRRKVARLSIDLMALERQLVEVQLKTMPP